MLALGLWVGVPAAANALHGGGEIEHAPTARYVVRPGYTLWDIAAAGLIAEEGGMRVTDVAGGPWFALSMASRSIGIVAASPAHHGRFLDLIR